MMLEVLVGALLYTAYKKSSSKGVMTSERQKVYESALEHLTDPVALRELAEEFERQGLGVEATMLRKRADLRGQSKATLAAHRAAFKKGMESKDVDGIEALANAFESMTATGTAAKLRQHAAEVRSAISETPVEELGKSEPELPEDPPDSPEPEEVHEAHVVQQAPRARRNGRTTNPTE
jgi:hypothetical protein